MTDKQIIDVTKCIHFDKSDIPNGCNCYWDGECNHYCYYKQLKRKEQECERLKDELSTYGATGICEVCTEKSILQNDRYRQTLIEIKKIADNREIFCENCGSGVESFTCEDCGYVKILQKISEALDE